MTDQPPPPYPSVDTKTYPPPPAVYPQQQPYAPPQQPYPGPMYQSDPSLPPGAYYTASGGPPGQQQPYAPRPPQPYPGPMYQSDPSLPPGAYYTASGGPPGQQQPYPPPPQPYPGPMYQPDPSLPPGAYYTAGGPPGLQQPYVVIQAPRVVVVAARPSEPYSLHIVFSCIVFWLCGYLFGLVAFILAIVARDSHASNPESARQFGRASLGVSIAGIVAGVLTCILLSVFL